MAFEETYVKLLQRIPGIADPIRRMSFKDKLKWTGIILLVYFLMSRVLVFGINQAGVQRFQFLEIVLGSQFGSLITLGIGPIVSAAIILQLLVGSKIIPWDLNTENGKIMFQGTQKLLAIILALVEAWAFVSFGAIPAASPSILWFVVLQIAIGGWLIIFMDELVSKWGFGSGVGLFIVAGVSMTIITRMFNPLTQAGTLPGAGQGPVGAIPAAITFMIGGDPLQAFFSVIPVIATMLVFFLVVYFQSINVEIPLAFSSMRGFGRRWPLKFFYTSNIPVILIGALLANIQVMGRMMAQGGSSWLGSFDSQGNPIGGLIYFLYPPQSQALTGLMVSIGLFTMLGIIVAYFTKRKAWKVGILFSALGGVMWFLLMSSMGLTGLTAVSPVDLARVGTYSLLLIGGSVVFSIFWVNTAGMDAGSVAEQIQSTGMQIPGYRRDIRIIQKVLNRYIPALAVLGGAAVGFLAAYADFTGALGTGTGILLATMIIYQLYEEIAMQHMEDMHPALRKFMGRG